MQPIAKCDNPKCLSNRQGGDPPFQNAKEKHLKKGSEFFARKFPNSICLQVECDECGLEHVVYAPDDDVNDTTSVYRSDDE